MRFGGRNPDVVEGQLGGRRAADAHLVLDARGGETGAVGLDDERAHPLPASGGRIGQREDGHDVRDRAVGDEPLRPVEDVLVTVARGPHPVRGHIRAGGGLGQGEGDQPLPAGQSREVSVLLLVGAGQEDRQRAELLDDRDQAGRRVGASDLLDEDGLGDRVEVRPTVALLEARAEQILLCQEVLEVVRELRLLVDLGCPRRDALVRQLAHDGTQLVVLGGGQVGHADSSRRSSVARGLGDRSLVAVRCARSVLAYIRRAILSRAAPGARSARR